MTKDLNESLHRFIVRTDSLSLSLNVVLPQDATESAACVPLHVHGRAFLVVRLISLWAEFCKEIVLKSALGATTISGTAIPRAPGIRSVADVRAKEKLSGIGANWHWQKYCMENAQKLAIRNYSQVSLGVGSAPTKSLMDIRNFVVHPNQSTRSDYVLAVRAIGVQLQEPDDLMRQRVVGGATLFEQWVFDFQDAALNAVK